MDAQKEGATIAKVIRERRSIRDFKPDPISVELVIELLNDAVWAPNHGLREPWRFILFQGEGKKKFAHAVIETYTAENKAKWEQQMLKYYLDVPLHLVVVMKEDPRQKKWEEDFSATSALIQNFQLLAWEKGVGVVWKTNDYNLEPSFHKAAGIKPGEKIVGTLHIGYFEKAPKPAPRTKAEERLTIISGN
ncbi:nitroreductase family protein [Paenibacillus beijingensis]|uniref:Putative NAD(P)H nitroreductase n=1 Tax=Paenibacillus beijingensis TaxID=1126833 RepID=A0A0D5NS10_9BACL|nr:nitroreductase [Paenibacillus beijingensis]AJY77945.1 nitroreductase [Paenibacillus beijingensis]